MCQHPNIIKLLDIFENAEYYYIVLEYMGGSDLFDYLQKRSFKTAESRAKQISYQIATAIQYLHSYGIVHRDLKLENVMMSNTSDQAAPKLVDFGLTKIIGPTETAVEPFGTLGYVAPEVLKKEPYSFSCDMWSLGCIIYAVISGSLPFDHDDNKVTIKMTLEDPLVFDLPCWKTTSQDCKDLVFGLLQKKPQDRFNLDQVLAHPWLKDEIAKHGKQNK